MYEKASCKKPHYECIYMALIREKDSKKKLEAY
jgi:hypothetical protein